MTDRQPDLIDALKRLVEDEPTIEGLRARDEVVRLFPHSDYLTRDIDFVGTVHLVHVSAPVFDSDGTVGATVMLLGPTRECSTAAEIRPRPGGDRGRPESLRLGVDTSVRSGAIGSPFFTDLPPGSRCDCDGIGRIRKISV